MDIVNAVLRPLFDWLLLPFRPLPPWVGVTVISALGGIGALLVYKYTSNQQALARVKDRIAASFFEIRLFNDDMRAILRAQWDLLRYNLRYMGLNLVPMAWMIVPFVLVIAQLQFHYGYSGLEPGKPALLKVALEGAADGSARPDVELDLPDGLELAGPGVWSPAIREMAWSLVPEDHGRYDVVVRVDGREIGKSVVVDERPTRRSPERLAPGFLDQLLYPAEPALPPDSGLRSISIDYPDAEIDLGFFRIHWLILFLVLSIAFAFLLRHRLGVTL